VEAQHSESYTFYVRADDGVRLWVGELLLVDEWHDQAPTEYYNNIPLTAGRRYQIQMDYYQNRGGAVAQLSWSSLSVPKQIIPRSQLSVEPPDARFLRGDSKSDGAVDLSDPVHVLEHLFLGGGAMICPDASDANDDGVLDISDPVATLAFLFLGRTPPPAPGPEACGSDPTEDPLPACLYDSENCPGQP
jgi:hypothetical protein